jgi:hypothetical protein
MWMGVSPTKIPGFYEVVPHRRTSDPIHDVGVVETQMNKTMSFRTTETSRILGADRALVSDGTYRVLATLEYRDCSYRTFGDLNIDDGTAQLRVFRFELASADEWFAQRKMNLNVVWPDFALLEHKVDGAEFVLRAPVRLNEAEAAEFFGPSGPPVT